MHPEKRALDGLRLLKQAVLMVLWDDPRGLRMVEIVNALDGESGRRDRHTYALYRAVIHMLLDEELIRKEGRRYVLYNRESADILFQFAYDSHFSVEHHIRNLLHVAREFGHEEIVASTLAEAAVVLNISPNGSNLDFTQPDEPAGSSGRSFRVKSTVFRVFTKPHYGAFKACLEDLRAGLSSHVLVPERFSSTARETAESIAPGRITVTTFEGFIGQIVADLAGHTRTSILNHLGQLLSLYNDQVSELMPDEPLRIKMLLDLPQAPFTVTTGMPRATIYTTAHK